MKVEHLKVVAGPNAVELARLKWKGVEMPKSIIYNDLNLQIKEGLILWCTFNFK